MLKKCLSAINLSFILLITGCQNNSTSGSKTELRVSTESDIQTLDPRLARDLTTIRALSSVYEGLFRSNEHGGYDLAAAEQFEISPDKKTYTFTIRPAVWSDGSPVTAQDFEQTWKSTLSPHFPAPNAYQLYSVKGAKEAKEGKGSIEQVGITAPDQRTLIVELNDPVPYFIELLTLPFFYPVHEKVRSHEGQLQSESRNFAFNGPFALDHWAQHNEFVLKKNPYYWDKDSVQLQKISFIELDNTTMLNMFRQKQLDWAGSAMSTIPTDALPSLKESGLLEVAPAPGVYMVRVNVESVPFNNKKMRRAFAYALNRKDLIDHVLMGNQIPAMGFVPSQLFVNTPYYKEKSFFKDDNVKKARKLFKQALAELNMSKEDLPVIELCYTSNERYNKIAQVVQQQWKNAFGIEVQLHACESKSYLEKIRNHSYQIGLGSWFGDFMDPITFLDVYKYKDNGTNNTQWENPKYIALLDNSFQASDEQARAQMLYNAEKILMVDMPIIPLFYSTYNYLRAPELKNVYFSDLAYKKAYKE